MDTDPLPGTLYIVATPVGNLEDMGFRAVRILKEVNLIAAEDTRHSKKLLAHYGISTGMISLHEHNETQRIGQLMAALKTGKNIALISDAGTPLVSDPGYCLVKAVSLEKIPVIPIPGPSAAIAGLSVSGLPTDRFLFCGFLPKKLQKQAQALTELVQERATLIFYESPQRICALIRQAREILGDRQACLAREISKLHEEYLRAPLSEILATLELRPQVKGECILFVEGAQAPEPMDPDQLEQVILSKLALNPSTADLAREISKSFQVPKKQVYDLILQLRDKDHPFKA